MDKNELIREIDRLRREKRAVIMAHYYQDKDIQDVADFIGDSLALAQQAARTDADIIVICGVHFMGETAKIICPGKKVLVPDEKAGCSLADSCRAEDLQRFIEAHPGYQVVSYVNTSAEVKALTDVVVTSSNAVKVIESFPADAKLIFGPDRHLGAYINRLTGRQMLLWDGACLVHDRFSASKIGELKASHPEAQVVCHPECREEVVAISDYAGSTAGLIKYIQESPCREFIVATESGVLHEMRKRCPDKRLLAAPAELPEDFASWPERLASQQREGCNLCKDMRLNTLEKLYLCLRDETPEIKVDAATAEKAVRSIRRMLELSAK